MRIQSVAALTGIAEATLRAWERRYGVPSPERAESGYRLYSEVHVEQILKMRKLCEGGISPAEAATSLREDAPSGKANRRVARRSVVEDVYEESIERILRAVLAFEDTVLDEEIRRLYYLDAPTAVLDRILQPLMFRIGLLWHDGELSVAHEHLLSQKVTLLLGDLVRLNKPEPPRGAALLACFPEEEHEIGLLAFALRLSSWGLRPILLGAKTPPSTLRRAVTDCDAKLVGLSSTTPVERTTGRKLMDEYATALQHVPWVVGGTGTETVADMVLARGGWVAPSSHVELEAWVMRTLHGSRRR